MAGKAFPMSQLAWPAKIAAALAVGAILFLSAAPWTNASADQPQSNGLNTIVFDALPGTIRLGDLATTGPATAADATTFLGSLTPAQTALLMQALGNAPAAPVATTPTASASTAAVTSAPSKLQVQRVTGKTVSSARGAKYGVTVTATATCADGQAVLGGGAQAVTSDGKNQDRATVAQSYASSTTTWTVVGVVTDDSLTDGQSLNVTATALCSD